ncbi:MAG: HIT domain-containing protein [Clostridia bacterium]|nr:HIT domain-containing protein [Clostridia bacterium]
MGVQRKNRAGKSVRFAETDLRKRLTPAILAYDGVNLLNASDESAGQSVPHFHIHIITRKRNDSIDGWPVFKGAKKS